MAEDNTSTSQNGSPGDLQFGAYLDIARRRKWWIVLSTIAFFVCAAVCAKRLPDIYRAETVILVDSAQVPDKYVPTINTGDIAGRLATLQQQVLSPTRLKKLVETEGLYPDAIRHRTEEQVIRAAQKAIVVEVVNPGAGKLSAFRIAYSSPDRSRVASTANHLARMFIDENLAARVNQAEDTAQFLSDQLEETKKSLDAKYSELSAIKSRNALDLPESKPYHMEAMANLRTQVQMIQDKITQDQREKGVIESMMMSGDDAPTVDVGGNTGSAPGTSSAYDGQIAKLESKLSELRGRYGPRHPDVRRTQDEINRLKAKAAAERKENPSDLADAQPAVVVQVPKKRRNPVLEAQAQKLQDDIDGQTRQLQPLQTQMAFHEAKLEHIPEFEQKITSLQQDYDALRVQYTGLLDNEKAAEISHALEVHQKGEKFEVLDAAVTPNLPASPNRLLISVAGLLGGLLAGAGLAAFAEMNDESVRSETEAARILGKPVLSGIPQIVSTQEVRRWRLQAIGALAGTLVGSIALGFLLSIVARGLF